MCEPNLIIAGVTAAATVAQGIAAKNSADQQAKNTEMEGRQALGAASAQANQVRDQASRELGKIRAVQSASGTDLSGGSGADFAGEAAQDQELNALHEMYKGRLGNWQKQYGAKVQRSEGNAALAQSGINAFGTLAGGAMKGGFFDKPTGPPPASSVKPLPLDLGYRPSKFG